LHIVTSSASLDLKEFTINLILFLFIFALLVNDLNMGRLAFWNTNLSNRYIFYKL